MIAYSTVGVNDMARSIAFRGNPPTPRRPNDDASRPADEHLARRRRRLEAPASFTTSGDP